RERSKATWAGEYQLQTHSSRTCCPVWPVGRSSDFSAPEARSVERVRQVRHASKLPRSCGTNPALPLGNIGLHRLQTKLELWKRTIKVVCMARKDTSKATQDRGFSDIIGIVLIATALLLMVAQLSFDRQDVTSNRIPSNETTHNWIGS